MIHGISTVLVAFAIMSFVGALLRSSRRRDEEETREIREVLQSRTFGPI